MPRPGRRTAGIAVLATVACGGAAAAAVASPSAPSRAQTPGGTMTRQLPQAITVAVSGRRVTVHFGSLRRRAVRTATVRFTRTGGRSTVVRRAKASGILRLTAPTGTRRVRLSVPSTREWTATSITRAVRR
ncbi:hypothetical protein [Patulibacter minatonensis]|uniref:hypothetical protein n=1 Tax=Patulibacter minatonensis TaxID=298163 RepID=UPI00047E7C17|nr:hypothetical protein [Patulibacter minatonensis]